ncbi:3'-phosphoadenosine 5'-phosphosulfate sulfotransferase (PAPS reductase)/FAD synthetase [Dysgonomonas sp. PFB1-18]|uniref:phosphoadenosine phosphosulfate reductase domain-containing protein n=1 Tax=unclassified Dysgonomonas TaxID=2630389 RepID=UPI0024748893|nr:MULTISPECIES: phosphoadenosine phosphosulfate reductase family protein [unclassified Dysgonomonas]MDH6309447.1 3'-phosphoadenosine 5'-phosphosulfate sulfotransferase (PAPS reductase)/FAD synthetase [Dysgonomonas sp. PF1-14]MDH6339688.1 3'-phosphoadenosine 5'-phosphosulfate sulfotransferase (PAPS reductase)/FAD synthetase [Dysgonomonas sp. PF1-16]MDH6381336.1 3'-phosphoadenosine 5'-phosphosulfate sulfotransferase (PAPS reductase)/FAD synthetase [Dysgonomonas sp. PFB1-18]MDH6398551.1 3'-phosph
MADTYYISSLSHGKDSLCMTLMLIEKHYPLDEVVFFNTGMEFKALYEMRDKVLPILKAEGIKYTELHPDKPFLYSMLEKPVKKRGTNIIHQYGYSWCGGPCRWGTSEKLRVLRKYIADSYFYVGLAVDEPYRFNKEWHPNRILPLAEWGITEEQALTYCYEKGFDWREEGIALYSILDRVSCWNCGNKNLKELYNIYRYLPGYWEQLKELQTKTNRPFRRKSGETIFDLEVRFQEKSSLEKANF